MWEGQETGPSPSFWLLFSDSVHTWLYSMSSNNVFLFNIVLLCYVHQSSLSYPGPILSRCTAKLNKLKKSFSKRPEEDIWTSHPSDCLYRTNGGDRKSVDTFSLVFHAQLKIMTIFSCDTDQIIMSQPFSFRAIWEDCRKAYGCHHNPLWFLPRPLRNCLILSASPFTR